MEGKNNDEGKKVELSPLALEYKTRIESAAKEGNTDNLEKVLCELAYYLFLEAEGNPFRGSTIGELDLGNQQIDKFNVNQLLGSEFDFVSGTSGQRIFFRENLEGKPVMFYPRPGVGDWNWGGKYWEEYIKLFGKEEVELNI